MKRIVRHLERVRRTARLLLLVRWLSIWVAALVAVAAVCAAGDYLLRLPGWLRLVIDAIIVVAAVRWIAIHLSHVRRFRPSLGDLALRAERLFPNLAGLLASGVEFTLAGAGDDRASRSGALASASIDRARREAATVPLRRLINPVRPLRALVVALVACVLLGVWANGMPAEASLAARRWFNPLGDAQWPRRTELRSLVRSELMAADEPLRAAAEVTRGYKPAMRTWVHYRWIDPDGRTTPWREALMNEQGEGRGQNTGRFERLIDTIELSGSTGPRQGTVEMYFSAGDDQTPPQTIRLVPRPALAAVTLHTEPPPYAQGLISAASIEMHEQTGPVATAAVHAGSMVRWALRFNKPLPEVRIVRAMLPGFPDDLEPTLEQDSTRIVVRFQLTESIETPIVLLDEHGLANLSQRQYRLSMIEDSSPSATMVQPAVDESVLASAVLDVAGAAQDDVAVHALRLEAKHPGGMLTLADVAGRRPRLDAGDVFDLGPLGLNVGDEVILTAVAEDGYDLAGMRHDPVRSAPRRLRIIDDAQLMSQIRGELAAVRQQAVRLESQQDQAQQSPARAARPPQEQITRRLTANRSLLDALAERIKRNRLDNAALDQTVEQAAALVEQAQQASRTATQSLEQAQTRTDRADDHLREARQAQQQVRQHLTELVDLLDQGRDALTLRLQLQQLAATQRNLAADTRQLLPQTAGREMEQLSEDEQRRIREMTDRQRSLARTAQELAQQMRTTAEALNQPEASEEQQAAAETLAEAASTAQRQGLSHAMDQASQAAEKNQLGEAGRNQEQAMATIAEMLEQMGREDQRRREILKRRLAQLADAVEQLVNRQTAQLDRLQQAEALTGLDEPLSMLRRNTMSVRDRAAATRETQSVAAELSGAVDHQAAGVTALRDGDKEPAVASESASLAQLRRALELVRDMADAAEREQMRQRREQLRDQYLELVRQQNELRDQTTPYLSEADLSRRQQAALRDLGHMETDLRIAAKELAGQADQPQLFEHVHQRIDTTINDIAQALFDARAEPLVVAQQDRAATMLRMLAGALEQAMADEPFDSGGAGGGGGGGGGGDQPLIPPAAQLKLFRGIQDDLYQRTRAMHDAPADAPTQRERTLQQLAVEQRELAAEGEQLIEQMRRQRQMTPQPPQPEPSP
jgi:hypothetical protein